MACWKHRGIMAVISACVWLAPTASAADEARLVVEMRRLEASFHGKLHEKLSPALLAVRDANAELLGADDRGNLVLSGSGDKLEQFKEFLGVDPTVSRALRDWKRVKTLMLTYPRHRKPDPEELARLGVALTGDYPENSFMTVEPLNKRIDPALVERLAASANVQYVRPNLLLNVIERVDPLPGVAHRRSPIPGFNDPRLDECWGLTAIGAPAAWKTTHGSNVIVAVIDTGVDYNHEDLKDNMWTDANGNHGFNFVDDNNDPMDHNGHGTYCAGIIGARQDNHVGIAGVTPAVKIMALRALNDEGEAEMPHLTAAFHFAVTHGAKVINVSWYWDYYDSDLMHAIIEARKAGVAVVVAAGNGALVENNDDGDTDQPWTKPRFPSTFPEDNIISVGAIDENERAAKFSNFGKKTVHLFAPGVHILTTSLGNRYTSGVSGTSMSAPFVTGAVALLMAVTGERNPKAIRTLLIQHVRLIPSLTDMCVSGGTLDLSFLCSARPSR